MPRRLQHSKPACVAVPTAEEIEEAAKNRGECPGKEAVGGVAEENLVGM